MSVKYRVKIDVEGKDYADVLLKILKLSKETSSDIKVWTDSAYLVEGAKE